MLFPTDRHWPAVLVLPVRNEALILERSVRAVLKILHELELESWLVIISSNNSTDNTNEIARRLQNEFANVWLIESVEAGKGGAIRRAWQVVSADYYFFSDVDLSVDLSLMLPNMIKAFAQSAEIVVASRNVTGAKAKRPWYRALFSFGYRLLSRLIVGTRLTDLPCGCKAVRERVIKELLPKVYHNDWFFDSELLLLAERLNYSIKELPANWVEYRYSDRPRQISLLSASFNYVKALFSFKRETHGRQ